MKLNHRFFLALALAFALAPATVAPRPAGAQSATTETQIGAHIRHLASEPLQGRRSGTEGAILAARYIAEAFKRYGLKPAAPNGYSQTFDFVASVKLGDNNRFTLKLPTHTRELKIREDFMPLAFSPSKPASGAVVFAGYGISAPELQYDNYAGLDVSGKIVMILRGSPEGDNPHGRFAAYTMPGLEIQNKTLKAREKGAAGVIFISGEDVLHADRLARLSFDRNFLDAGIPTVVISRAIADGILGSANSSLAAQEARIKSDAAPLAIDLISVQFTTDVVHVRANGENVIALLEGSDPQLKSEYVIIGAHYDHLGLGGPESLAARPDGAIHYGADDNASGTAALLEVARTLAANRQAVKRSVLFMAFAAEELGLLGSAAYTKEPLVPLGSTVVMINMDMVGRLRNNSLFVGGVGTSPAWKPLLERLNGESGDAPRFTLSMGQDGFGPSDHQSFYVRDIPVLFFFTGTHDDYHKPTDTAEKINVEGVARIAGFVGEVAMAVANEPQRIAFNRVQTESRPMGRGFRVYLGTVPNYSDQGDGLKLDGVRPGSPAERAGLRQGDVITRIGNFPIKNVYDYTYALGELKAGEEVEVAIKREGREMTLKLTPDKRN